MTKQLGFHLIFKTADLQNTFYTMSATNITVTIDMSIFYVTKFIAEAKTQKKFKIQPKRVLPYQLIPG